MTDQISKFMDFNPTSCQMEAVNAIETFIDNTDDFLVISGAAGTGKTSIMKAAAKYVSKKGQMDVCLMAPTAMAARNLAQKTDCSTSTIHSAIYSVDVNIDKVAVKFTLKNNTHDRKVLFIVDESSMISNLPSAESVGFEAAGPLLTNLVKFAKMSQHGFKFIFVGDNCQLLPIGYKSFETAPALSVDVLHKQFGMQGSMIALSDVMRQKTGSSILENANAIRNSVLAHSKPYLNTIGKKIMGQDQAVERYLQAYDVSNPNAAVIISFSNKYAMECNLKIRARLGLICQLAVGDRVVLSKHYFGKSQTVSNGEYGTVQSIGNKTAIAGLTFVEAKILFKTFDNEAYSITAQVLIESLNSRDSITQEQQKELVALAYKHNVKFRESKDLRDDQFLSAMYLSYAHAFTCYKAQGSEWDTVIFNSWMPQSGPDYRFLYTGVSRAKHNLYCNDSHLINFGSVNFENINIARTRREKLGI